MTRVSAVPRSRPIDVSRLRAPVLPHPLPRVADPSKADAPRPTPARPGGGDHDGLLRAEPVESMNRRVQESSLLVGARAAARLPSTGSASIVLPWGSPHGLPSLLLRRSARSRAASGARRGAARGRPTPAGRPRRNEVARPDGRCQRHAVRSPEPCATVSAPKIGVAEAASAAGAAEPLLRVGPLSLQSDGASTSQIAGSNTADVGSGGPLATTPTPSIALPMREMKRSTTALLGADSPTEPKVLPTQQNIRVQSVSGLVLHRPCSYQAARSALDPRAAAYGRPVFVMAPSDPRAAGDARLDRVRPRAYICIKPQINNCR
ncbi:hypothetical protein Pla175_26510 [Pirellulimonas nuda]|uniref:Uncharacterized protein n=1 Tax=Pirellulimonas nuda TaxID=2528009 RepID=A0A518DCT1_9BACT|nr:hypothetical protein Pla175_26510 [Pirellulimonas nuda]